MKRNLLYAAMLLFACCTPKNEVTAQQTMTQKLYLTINGTTMAATLVDNSSTQALVAALQVADIVYEAHDYGNFEKVGPLGQSFPQNNEDITTTAGDMILYQGSNLCIYYATNTWDFTRIGHIDGATSDNIRAFVNAGGGNVTVTLSLTAPTTALDEVSASDAHTPAYTVSGQQVPEGYKGVVIQNGKKELR